MPPIYPFVFSSDFGGGYGIYRDIAYVTVEVEQLAAQLVEIQSEKY